MFQTIFVFRDAVPPNKLMTSIQSHGQILKCEFKMNDDRAIAFFSSFVKKGGCTKSSILSRLWNKVAEKNNIQKIRRTDSKMFSTVETIVDIDWHLNFNCLIVFYRNIMISVSGSCTLGLRSKTHVEENEVEQQRCFPC